MCKYPRQHKLFIFKGALEAVAPETMEERKGTRIEGRAGEMREVKELLAYSNSKVIIL